MVEDSVTTGPPNWIGTRSDVNALTHTHVVYHHIERQASKFGIIFLSLPVLTRPRETVITWRHHDVVGNPTSRPTSTELIFMFGEGFQQRFLCG